MFVYTKQDMHHWGLPVCKGGDA